MLDIHSHILPNVDDGAKNVGSSIEILSSMKRQGITDVIATPHFYPHSHDIEHFIEKTQSAYQLLRSLPESENLPNIHLGCELLYYNGISQIQTFEHFTINNSNYLLLELTPYDINKSLFNDILTLKYERNIIPIIAHIERYHTSRKYKNLLKFVKINNIQAQVNATSFFSRKYASVLKELFRKDIVTYIGTDSHSMSTRPPMMKHAFEVITHDFDVIAKLKLLKNAENLLKEITKKDNDNDEIQQP